MIDKIKPADWQVLVIQTDDTFIEIDCNSGRKRKMRKNGRDTDGVRTITQIGEEY